MDVEYMLLTTLDYCSRRYFCSVEFDIMIDVGVVSQMCRNDDKAYMRLSNWSAVAASCEY